MGGVLFQLKDVPAATEAIDKHKECLRIVMFMSFRLENAETRYTTTEREALAVVRCLAETSKHPTKIYSDHSALESIFRNGTDAHGQIARWMDRLTEYDYEVHHRPCRTDSSQKNILDGFDNMTEDFQYFIFVFQASYRTCCHFFISNLFFSQTKLLCGCE